MKDTIQPLSNKIPSLKNKIQWKNWIISEKPLAINIFTSKSHVAKLFAVGIL